MIVHHTSDDGDFADVSFLLAISPDADENEFFENLQPYRWVFDSDSIVELSTSPNLNNIV